MTTGKFARAAKTFNDSSYKDNQKRFNRRERTQKIRSPDAAQRNPDRDALNYEA